MGLGELLSGLFGDTDGQKDVAERNGAIARVVDAAFGAAKRFTGKEIDPALEKEVKKNYTDVLELLMKPTPLGAVNEVSKLVIKGDEDAQKAAETIADDLITALTGRTAELQLEAILGERIGEDMPFTSRLSTQMALVTDISLAASTASIIAEVASIGQIDQVGRELRSYLDYSGLSQVTGFGYGMILSSALTAGVQQEINQKIPLTLVDPAMLTILKRRGEIDEEKYRLEMGKHGFNSQNVDRFYKATEFYPSGTDFISFAVRDVFNPAVVEAGGLDDAFPTDIVEFAEKAGMPEDVLRWYWRAHWQLPSPQMGYEMLHRGIITEDDLRHLLRAADWAPGYIDALMAISYNPLTRVDARRMYETGVLDDEGYKRAMMDLGYTEENAELYLAWVNAEKPQKEKDLTETTIKKAYNTGLVTPEQYKQYLRRFGYDDEEAELIIALEDQKVAEELLEDQIALLQWRYSRAEIVEETFYRNMDELGIPRAKATRYLSKAESDKVKRAKLPSLETVKRWLQGELITKEEAKDYLTRLGYRAKERDLFMREWTE